MIITLIRFKSKIKTKTWFLFQNNYLLILSRLHTFRFVMNHIRSAKRTLVLVPRHLQLKQLSSCTLVSEQLGRSVISPQIRSFN